MKIVWLKGTISDSLGLRKLFEPFRIKKNTCQLQHVPFFLQNRIKKNGFSSDFIALFLSIGKFPKILE